MTWFFRDATSQVDALARIFGDCRESQIPRCLHWVSDWPSDLILDGREYRTQMVTQMKNHEIMSASEKGMFTCPASGELDRDVFCHDMIDGKLLQTDKKYSQLKQKQKDKIAVWMYEETRKYYERTGKYPIEHHDDEIVDAVYERITDADIWIPYGEVAKHYHGVRAKITRRIRREETEKQHPPEKVIFMNMCMLCDGDQVLALDKTGSNYNGTTFPGGHVEAGETFSEAVVREMKEETGLTIQHPVLKGIYHWYRNGLHNVTCQKKSALAGFS